MTILSKLGGLSPVGMSLHKFMNTIKHTAKIYALLKRQKEKIWKEN